MKNLLILIILSTSITFTGCIKQTTSLHINKDKREKYILARKSWQAQGRISLQSNDRSFSAHISMTFTPNGYIIEIKEPLAAAHVIITSNNDLHVVKTTEDGEFASRDLESLMEEKLGWYIPTESLRYWLKSVPSPGSKFRINAIAENSIIKNLYQDGWQIDFKDFTQNGPVLLARKIWLEQDDVTLKFFLYKINLDYVY